MYLVPHNLIEKLGTLESIVVWVFLIDIGQLDFWN